MHTLILAENRHQAVFVQRGLEYEDLGSDVVYFNDKDAIQNALHHQVDGLFIAMGNVFNLDKIIEYCRHIRNDLPIIVLAREFNLLLRELQQNKKINRFFMRPFPFRLIASEMRSCIFQQKEKMGENFLRLRSLELNREKHELNYNGKILHLRNKEYALLEFLMLNQSRVLGRETILENVWDRNADMLTNTVDVHISRLRKKIDYFVGEQFIHTVVCAGYIFC